MDGTFGADVLMTSEAVVSQLFFAVNSAEVCCLFPNRSFLAFLLFYRPADSRASIALLGTCDFNIGFGKVVQFGDG